jgi:uncharacterized membrane protein
MNVSDIKDLFQIITQGETFWLGIGVLFIWVFVMFLNILKGNTKRKLQDEVAKNATLAMEVQNLHERLHRAEGDRDEFREKYFHAQNEMLKYKFDSKMKTEQLTRT